MNIFYCADINSFYALVKVLINIRKDLFYNAYNQISKIKKKTPTYCFSH